MAADDLARRAKQAFQNEKVQAALRTQQAEDVSDAVLDRAAGLADRLTGGRYTEQVAQGRHAADERIGTDAERRDPAAERRPPAQR
jgi:hypothetical protein